MRNGDPIWLTTRRGLLAGMAGALLLAGRTGPAAADNGPPLAGEFADYFNVLRPPVPAWPVVFGAPGGGETSIKDFRGRVVLLNFWATWCPPCVVEMPGLDRLQADLGEQGVSVVTVSQDRGGEAAVQPFFAKHGLRNLKAYTDTKGYAAEAFGVRGLPTSFLIDAAGRIVGGLEGPADWASPEGEALVRYYLAPPKQKDGTAT